MQLVLLENAALVTNHAAVVAARAATVIAPDDPRYYGSAVNTLEGRRREEIVEAVRLLVGTTTHDPEVDVKIDGQFSRGGSLTATVTFTYPCRIPYGGHLVCGLKNRRKITRTAQMPYQGAPYEYP